MRGKLKKEKKKENDDKALINIDTINIA